MNPSKFLVAFFLAFACAGLLRADQDQAAPNLSQINPSDLQGGAPSVTSVVAAGEACPQSKAIKTEIELKTANFKKGVGRGDAGELIGDWAFASKNGFISPALKADYVQWLEKAFKSWIAYDRAFDAPEKNAGIAALGYVLSHRDIRSGSFSACMKAAFAGSLDSSGADSSALKMGCLAGGPFAPYSTETRSDWSEKQIQNWFVSFLDYAERSAQQTIARTVDAQCGGKKRLAKNQKGKGEKGAKGKKGKGGAAGGSGGGVAGAGGGNAFDFDGIYLRGGYPFLLTDPNNGMDGQYVMKMVSVRDPSNPTQAVSRLLIANITNRYLSDGSSNIYGRLFDVSKPGSQIIPLDDRVPGMAQYQLNVDANGNISFGFSDPKGPGGFADPTAAYPTGKGAASGVSTAWLNQEQARQIQSEGVLTKIKDQYFLVTGCAVSSIQPSSSGGAWRFSPCTKDRRLLYDQTSTLLAPLIAQVNQAVSVAGSLNTKTQLLIGPQALGYVGAGSDPDKKKNFYYIVCTAAGGCSPTPQSCAEVKKTNPGATCAFPAAPTPSTGTTPSPSTSTTTTPTTPTTGGAVTPPTTGGTGQGAAGSSPNIVACTLGDTANLKAPTKKFMLDAWTSYRIQGGEVDGLASSSILCHHGNQRLSFSGSITGIGREGGAYYEVPKGSGRKYLFVHTTLPKDAEKKYDKPRPVDYYIPLAALTAPAPQDGTIPKADEATWVKVYKDAGNQEGKHPGVEYTVYLPAGGNPQWLQDAMIGLGAAHPLYKDNKDAFLSYARAIEAKKLNPSDHPHVTLHFTTTSEQSASGEAAMPSWGDEADRLSFCCKGGACKIVPGPVEKACKK